MKADRALRLPGVIEVTGLSSSAIYRMVQTGDFPRPFRLTPTGTAAGWSEREVQDFLEKRKAAPRTSVAKKISAGGASP